MPTPGRPRVLDEPKRREICALISAGCGLEDAARYVGCSCATIRREQLRNPEFKERLRKAECFQQLAPLEALRKHAANSWRAAAWLLERTNPDRFGRSKADQVSPVQFDAFMDFLGEALAKEFNDPKERKRIGRRLHKIALRAEREAIAVTKPYHNYSRARQRFRLEEAAAQFEIGQKSDPDHEPTARPSTPHVAEPASTSENCNPLVGDADPFRTREPHNLI